MKPEMPEGPPESWPDGTGPGPHRPEPQPADVMPPDGHRRRFAGPPLVVGFLVAAALLAAAAAWAFGQAGTEEGPYRVLETDEYEAEITSCRVEPDGRPVATGSVRNLTGATQVLVVEIGLIDPDGVVIDTPRATLVNVAADADASWQVASPYEIPRLTPLSCRVEDVYATPRK